MARNRYDVDETLETKFDVNQLKRITRYVSPYKKKMAAVIFLMLSASALTMTVPLFLQKIMDEYIPGKNMDKILISCLLIFLIALYSAISLRLKIRTMSHIGQNIIHSIRSDIFAR